MPSSKITNFIFVCIKPGDGLWTPEFEMKIVNHGFWEKHFDAYYQIIEDRDHTHLLGYPKSEYVGKKFDVIRAILKAEFGPFKFAQRALDTRAPDKGQDDIGAISYMMKGLYNKINNVQLVRVFNLPQEMIDAANIRAKYIYGPKELKFLSLQKIGEIAYKKCATLTTQNANNLSEIENSLLRDGYIFAGNELSMKHVLRQCIKRYWLKLEGEHLTEEALEDIEG